MPTSFSGGCACGAIRYESSCAPLAMINCHCRDCQRTSGGAYVPNVILPADALKITKGEPAWFSVAAESGNTLRRGFCATCGSHLFGVSSGNEALLGVRAGTLDDPSWFQPMANIWTRSAQPWDVLDPKTPSFPQAPPRPKS